MKRVIGASALMVFVLIGLTGCDKQRVEVGQESPPAQQQEVNLALNEDRNILGFQTGSFYVLSVEDWGNWGTRYDAGDAFRKFYAEAKKLEEQGWVLNPTSIQTSRTQYSAWIVAIFHKRE